MWKNASVVQNVVKWTLVSAACNQDDGSTGIGHWWACVTWLLLHNVVPFNDDDDEIVPVGVCHSNVIQTNTPAL